MGAAARDANTPGVGLMSADELADMVAVATLADISFAEISARRVDGDVPSDGVIPVSPEFQTRVQVMRNDEAELVVQYHLVLTLDLIVGNACVHCVATYLMPTDHPEPSRRALAEFANGVAVMMMVPYVRQALHDVTTKTFPWPVLMPIMGRGDLVFPWSDDDHKEDEPERGTDEPRLPDGVEGDE